MRACGTTRSEPPASSLAPDSIAAAADAFLKSLGAEHRDRTHFSFDDDRRLDWHFVPKQREGVPYKELSPDQRRLADALVFSGLGAKGFEKFDTVRSLEPILRELEQGRGPARDPELYYVAVFGTPRDSAPWGWSVEGHHISLNFTLVGPDRIASTPVFLGANPAEVRHGPRKGLRALAAEEDAARAVVLSLDAAQRERAVVSAVAPREILSWNSRKADPIQPAGLRAGALSGRQRELLMSVLAEYAGTMAPNIAAARMNALRAAGVDEIHFAWAGPIERGQPHYYRIQGPSFLVEYDNTQNGANHIHSVWRDFAGDFGLDLLATHYERSHKRTE
jgi:hypothetical protein